MTALRLPTLLVTLLLGLTLTPTARAATPEDDARAVLAAWLAAQNGGDFAAYQRLYAARFGGVRRSGESTVSLDRKGWLRDRQRMFQKPMKVEVSNVVVAATAGSAQLQFTQLWQSGTYKDTGPKRMVLAREGAGLLIAREEMLASEQVAAAALTRESLARADHLYLDGKYVVLQEGAPESWGKGALRLLAQKEQALAGRGAADDKLPPEVAAWRGHKVRLYGDAGALCEATVRELLVVGRMVPHFGTREEWQRAAPAKIAEEIWQMSAGHRLLMGELTGMTPACADKASWARGAALPAVASGASAAADKATQQAALAAFRKLRAYAKVQKSYEEYKKGDPTASAARWENFADAKPEVKLLRAAVKGGTRSVVVVRAGGESGCGGFSDQLWAFFDVAEGGGAPTLTLRAAGDDPGMVRPRAAADLDGDGTLEVILDYFVGQGVLRGAKIEKLEIPYFDCPC